MNSQKDTPPGSPRGGKPDEAKAKAKAAAAAKAAAKAKAKAKADADEYFAIWVPDGASRQDVADRDIHSQHPHACIVRPEHTKGHVYLYPEFAKQIQKAQLSSFRQHAL